MGDAGRKRIALLLGQADEQYQSEFIEGVVRQSRKNNYDVCVFSMFIKYQNSREREIGDSNIFELINYSCFDAVILLIDTIQTPGKAKDIEEKIKKVFSGPVVCIDASIEGFECFYLDGYNSIYSIVSHLIEVHGFKDIAFLTGKKFHRHSQRRVEAFLDAMKDHHLEVPDDRVLYGDFWYSSGSSYAETLLRDKGNMPEAVACANDCMAIGLAETLTDNGIRVPEDIAITGYGATDEAVTSPSPLTSAYVPAKYYGSYSVKCIHSILNKQNPPKRATRASLFIGCSCGCNKGNESLINRPVLRDKWTTDTSDDGIYSIHNFMPDDLMIQTGLEGFLNTVYSNLYQIKGIKSYHLCLNKQWIMDDKFSQINMPVNGYADEILHAIKYYANVSSRNAVSIEDTFSLKHMLPELWTSPEPVCYIFTPIFFEEKCFGYSVISFEDKYSYDEIFRVWTSSVANGLECLRREFLLQYVMNRNVSDMSSKFPQHLSEQDKSSITNKLSKEEKDELSEVERLLDNNLFEYHFQPIVSVKTGEIYSYEALMRPKSDKRISPLTVLKYADIMDRLPDVERLTFINVLSRVNDEESHFKNRKVFINSIPGCRLSDNVMEEIAKLLRVCKTNVVMELTEQAELTNEDLERVKSQNETYNLQLAVDDYGTGYSNVSNLLRYMPNYVKIDRSLLSDIQNSSQKKHFVKNIIEFCHENSILALAEGIETTEELREVIDLGADLVQGYYTARPTLRVIDQIDEEKKKEVNSYYKQSIENNGRKQYLAGRTNRVILNNLVKEGVGTIVIGNPEAIHRDITIVGTPGKKTGISLEIQDKYEGRITFENAYLTNESSKPVIKLGENCNVIIDLEGDNYLEKGGILVPESSALELEGDGNLYITANSKECFAIGNEFDKKHGQLSFYQDGSIYINIGGYQCIGIGSGLGGEVNIKKGRYVITINAEIGVGIGNLTQNAVLEIQRCDFETNLAVMNGVCVGSLEGDVEMRVWGSSLKCYASGNELVAFGTLKGKAADIDIHEASTAINVRGDFSTAIGCIYGKTEFRCKRASLRAIMNGTNSVTFGSPSPNYKDTKVLIQNSEIMINQDSSYEKECLAPEGSIRVVDGRYRVKINDKNTVFDEDDADSE
jgi:FOG: EAL domain